MLPFMWAAQEKCLATIPAVLTNNGVIFTITGGPIQILELGSVCTVTNAGTGTTLQYSSTPAVGTAATISGASASLTSCAAGSTVLLTPTALTTAPTIVIQTSGGVQLGLVAQNHIVVLNGTLTTVAATILSTARWYHFIRYKPLTMDSLVA
jgi:hypothetical protein